MYLTAPKSQVFVALVVACGMLKVGFARAAPAMQIHSVNQQLTIAPATATQAVYISNHGGPVMLGTPNIYIIWYGNWAGNSATSIIPDFLSQLGGSPYYGINAGYYSGVPSRGSAQWVSNSLKYAGSRFDNYSQGLALSDSAIVAIVNSSILSATNPSGFPEDFNGIYLVLTSADVSQSGNNGTFGIQYCGWHGAAPNLRNNNYRKFAFVGDASQIAKPSNCIWQPYASPNGNVGADGMVSVIAHEVEETVTDPLLSTWYTSTGQENADLCAWTFGAMYYVGNGSQANMKLGARDYLVQQNWINAPLGLGYCALSR